MAVLSSKASDTILSSYRLQLPWGPALPPGVLPIAPQLDNLPGRRDEPDPRRTRLCELDPTTALLDHRDLSYLGRAAGDPASDRSP
jgi:hypothetical protein